MKPYSLDLRLKVLDAVDCGIPQEELVGIFGVSMSTIDLCFNHEEFCDGLYVHRKTLAFAVFLGSGGLFEGRVALSSARTAPFGPPRRSPAGFRRFRWRPQCRQKR